MFTKLRDFKRFPIYLILNLYFDIKSVKKKFECLKPKLVYFTDIYIY